MTLRPDPTAPLVQSKKGDTCVKPRKPPTIACIEKIQYADRITALIAAAQIRYRDDEFLTRQVRSNGQKRHVRRRRKSRDGHTHIKGRVVPYLCPVCHLWHLTHTLQDEDEEDEDEFD